MYPIERTDYINAYIGAISDEMLQARIARPRASDRSRAFDRFSKAVARLLGGFKGSKQHFAVEQTLEARPWLRRVSSNRGSCVADC